jgi:hypothetical protein
VQRFMTRAGAPVTLRHEVSCQADGLSVPCAGGCRPIRHAEPARAGSQAAQTATGCGARRVPVDGLMG